MTPQSLHVRLVDALGRRIVGGQLRPGDTFTVADIEAEFAVSRSVAREVVRVLESLGLVHSRTKVGCTVLDASAWNALSPQVIRWQMQGPSRTRSLASLVELRAGIEPVAAGLAARRASWDHVEVMAVAASRMAELGRQGRGDSSAFLEADIVFHDMVLRATANLAYVALAPTVIACLRERNAAGLTPAVPAAANLDHHVNLAEAIGRRDVNEAERLSRAIVSVVVDETDA